MQRSRTTPRPEPPAESAHGILTLTFCSGSGDTRVYSRSHCFRLCADGTMRSGDNSVAALRVATGWRVGKHIYRDFSCAGPVMLMVRGKLRGKVDEFGPCERIRIVNGQLYADDVCLGIDFPASKASFAVPWDEALLLPQAMPR